MKASLRKKVREVLAQFGADPELVNARGLLLHPDAIDLVVAEVGEDGMEHRLGYRQLNPSKWLESVHEHL